MQTDIMTENFPQHQEMQDGAREFTRLRKWKKANLIARQSPIFHLLQTPEQCEAVLYIYNLL